MDQPRTRTVPETPFGRRLRAARKMAGLSMEDLAGKLGGMITKQAIGKYETGLMMPSPEVLEKLVAVLKIATWGASPLRLTDADRDEAAVLGSERLFDPVVPGGPKLRRAGLLARLHGRGQKTGSGNEDVICCSLQDGVGDRADLRERSDDDMAREAPAHALITPAVLSQETFPSLASRRARFLREWEADAGRNRIRFREGEKLSAKTETALKYRIADHLQKYLELESVLGQEAAFCNPVAGRPTASREEVESAAAEVRRLWDLGAGPIVNLLGLLEDKGIKVYETRGVEGFEGLSGRYGELPFVAVSMERPADRIRFTAAHELGHALCDLEAAESPEGDCHTFGAAFLLPRPALEAVFRPSRRKMTMADLGEIKETYGVSLQAIMYRAHGLAFISDRQLRSFRETLKEKGWLVEEPVAYTGLERATRFRRLLHYAVAEHILDPSRAAEMAGVTVEDLEKEIGEIF